MSDYDPDVLAGARAALAAARTVTALTGAGISAESGLPTFRGAGGLWRNYRPEELATPEAFARDPYMVWVWFGEGLPEDAFEDAYEASRAADVFLSIGTSGVVHPAAGLIEIARRAGRIVIEVNPDLTAAASPKRYRLPGPAGAVLPALISSGGGPRPA